MIIKNRENIKKYLNAQLSLLEVYDNHSRFKYCSEKIQYLINIVDKIFDLHGSFILKVDVESSIYQTITNLIYYCEPKQDLTYLENFTISFDEEGEFNYTEWFIDIYDISNKVEFAFIPLLKSFGSVNNEKYRISHTFLTTTFNDKFKKMFIKKLKENPRISKKFVSAVNTNELNGFEDVLNELKDMLLFES